MRVLKRIISYWLQRIVLLCGVLFIPPFLFFLFSQSLQTGKASFYSKRATGSRTANGELLHHDSMTCAHRSFPFGTMLKVTNMANGKEVVVRVTDRGPYRRGRIIDLSWGAAKAIGMLAQGITTVKVERVGSGVVIPFKPEDSPLNQPIFEFDIAEIADGQMPIWIVEDKIDDKKAKKQMKETVEAKSVNQQAENAMSVLLQNEQGATPSTKQTAVTTKKPLPKEAEAQGDVLDLINTQPNRSKAYLKRQGQPVKK